MFVLKHECMVILPESRLQLRYGSGFGNGGDKETGVVVAAKMHVF